ncbi:MAG: hypothetical protein IJ563_10480 [Selenomonadaceae bacterium]|nr:hypothetical protein [Selenomonadaceae bacterium]
MSNKNKHKINKRKDKQPNVSTDKEKHKTAQIPTMPDDYIGKRIYDYVMQVDTPKSLS